MLQTGFSPGEWAVRKSSIAHWGAAGASGAAYSGSQGLRLSQLASLYPHNPDALAAELKERGFSFVSESNIEVRRCPVEVRTLDSFDVYPDIIKIDVEGAELSVLKGALRMIERHAHTPLTDAVNMFYIPDGKTH